MSTEREQVKIYKLSRITGVLYDDAGLSAPRNARFVNEVDYLSEHERAEKLEKALRAIIDECPKEDMWSGLYGAMQEYRYYKVTEAAIESGKSALGGQSD